MKEVLTFITGNKAKVKWLQTYLDYPITHQKIDLDEIQSLDLKEVVLHKANQAFAQLHKPVLVEDTSLRFNSLGKLPGPLVKWFLEELGVNGMCELLNGYADRSAVAEVLYGLHTGDEVVLFDGSVNGSIAPEGRGTNGFGWDSAFIPDGSTKTWAEMDTEEQKQTSLRRLAVQKLEAYLNNK